MNPDSRAEFKPNWDLYFFALAALYLFYQLMQWPLLPKFVDIYYHLAVVKGFSDAGGWVARDTWEFAPAGCPHLYPPFLHALLLIPYRLGVPVMDLARAVDVSSFPLLLGAFWSFVRAREGSRTAFWAAFLFSTVYASFLSSVTLPAFNLAMIGALAALHFLSSGRALAAGLAAAAVGYTHTLAAGMLAGMFAAAALFEPGCRKNALRAFVLAAGLCSPMLIWQARNAGAFKMIAVGENNLLELDPFLYGLAAVRVVRSLRRRRPDVWPLALFLGMAPVIPFRQARVLGGYGVLAAAWLSALEILDWCDAIARSRGRRTAVQSGALAALFFAFLAPTLLANLEEGRWRLQPMDRTLVRYLVPDETRDFRAKGFSIYFKKEYDEILEVLRERSSPGDIVWTDFPHAGGILYLLSGHPLSTAMLGEVGSWDDRQARLRAAKILIWFKTGEGKIPNEVWTQVQALGLRPLAETSLCYLYENPSGGTRPAAPRAEVPLAALWAVLAVWAAALAWAAARKPQRL